MATSNSNNNNLQNSIICTSCGQSIHLLTKNDEYYKCQQCAYHHVCKTCSQLPAYNDRDHQLIKVIMPSNIQTSSIFTDQNYLTTFLGYCSHCLNIVYVKKELCYRCDQCPLFLSCQKCLSLMSTQHPHQHTFVKFSCDDIIGHHIGVICNNCREENISGPRYKCEQCHSSYDLCSKCFLNPKKYHNNSHTFRMMQDPLVRCNNRKTLAERVVELFRRQNVTDNDQRDPMTGWTKSDAEKIIQQEDETLKVYQEKIGKVSESYKQQQTREQKALETYKRIHEAQQKTFEENMARSQEVTRMIGTTGQMCPRCKHYF